MTSTEFVVGAVTVEVVTLAELSAVAFLRVLPLLALAGSTDAVSVVAADVRPVVLATVLVHVLAGDVVAAALTLPANTTLVTFAGSTLEGAISTVAERAVLLSLFVTFTLADEVEQDLHLFGKTQRLDFDGLGLTP